MPGILDFLQQGDNPLGLALLAAGGPTTDPNQAGFGYRLASAAAQGQASRDSQADRALKLRFTNSQIAENDSQAVARTEATAAKRQQLLNDQYFLTGAAPGGVAPQGAGFGGMTAQQISDKFGIPMEAIVADYRTGGKKLSEFIEARTKPNIQLVGGTPYDLNKAPLGQELPGYRAGKLEDRRLAVAGETVQIPDPNNPGAMLTVLRESLIGGSPAAPPPPAPVRAPMIGTGPVARTPDNYTVRGGVEPPYKMADRTGELRLVLEAELKDPTLSEADRAGIKRELARAGGPQPVIGAGGVLGRTESTAEKNAQDVKKAEDIKRAERKIDKEFATDTVDLKGAERLATERAAAKVKAETEAPKVKQQQRELMEKADRIIGDVDSAIGKVGVTTAGLAGPAIAMVPGTGARDLRATLDTVKANLGFAELQAMRASSPTGGALGSVAVKELEALQSTVASLDQGQSPGQLKAKLGQISTHYKNWKKAVADAAATSGASGEPAAATPKAAGAPSVDDLLKKYGGGR